MNEKKLFKRIVTTLEKCEAKKIAVFCSYARDEAKPESDANGKIHKSISGRQD